MLKSNTINMYTYKMGKPKMKIVLLNADIIGKFNKMAANMQTKAKR